MVWMVPLRRIKVGCTGYLSPGVRALSKSLRKRKAALDVTGCHRERSEAVPIAHLEIASLRSQ